MISGPKKTTVSRESGKSFGNITLGAEGFHEAMEEGLSGSCVS